MEKLLADDAINERVKIMEFVPSIKNLVAGWCIGTKQRKKMSLHCYATVDLIAKAVYGLVSYDVLTNTKENAFLGLKNVNFVTKHCRCRKSNPI